RNLGVRNKETFYALTHRKNEHVRAEILAAVKRGEVKPGDPNIDAEIMRRIREARGHLPVAVFVDVMQPEADDEPSGERQTFLSADSSAEFDRLEARRLHSLSPGDRRRWDALLMEMRPSELYARLHLANTYPELPRP